MEDEWDVRQPTPGWMSQQNYSEWLEAFVDRLVLVCDVFAAANSCLFALWTWVISTDDERSQWSS
jgi:hypothetical protein